MLVKSKYYTNLNPLRLKWVKERVYALGTWFYKDKNKNVSENVIVKLTQIDQLLQNWRGRSLKWLFFFKVMSNKPCISILKLLFSVINCMH